MDTVERKEARKQEIKRMYEPDTILPGAYQNQIKNNYIIKLGLISGILMSFYLLALNLLTESDFGMAKYLQYFILAGFIYLALARNERAKTEGKVFQRGMMVGGLVALFSGLSLLMMDLFFSFIAPELTFRQFDQEMTGITETLVSSFGLALEVIVFGMMITFILLQLKKVRSHR